MGLFFFLANILLIIALFPLWAIIGIILWKLKYAILAIVIPVIGWFVWAGCINFWYH